MKIYKKWLKPNECISFWKWLYHEWNFVNVEKIHEWGIRILGLSISNFKEERKTFTRRCTICGRTPVCTSCNKCFNDWCNSGCRVCRKIRWAG